jgi:hypothetical protein
MINDNNNKHAFAGQLNSSTRLRALLVLDDRGDTFLNDLFEMLWNCFSIVLDEKVNMEGLVGFSRGPRIFRGLRPAPEGD